MLLKFKIIAKQNLLIDYLEGDTSYQALENFHLKERQHPDIIYVTKVLSNISQVNFKFSHSEVNKYIEQLKITSKEVNLKWAIISNSAVPTALSQLIKEDPYFTNKIEVFSTLRAACQFLEIDYQDDLFNQDDFEIIS